MSHNYLQLSLDVVRALVGPENAQLLQLNASQCGALKTKLLETATSLQDFVDALSPIDRRLYETSCKTALQEFYRVVKDAEAIIQSCCDKNWLQAAIKLANNTEAFVDVIFKLDWCTAVLGNLSRDVIPGEWNLPKYRATLIGEVDRVGMMGEIERMLRVDAMDDRENLRRRLGELQNGTEALDLRQDIILHLLRITDPAAEDEQKTEKGDFLLTIEPKELRRMQCIGEGAFAVVHKISWLGQSFAGKYYKRPSYLQERKILADLSHPHVTQVFGCTTSDPCCLVMELMHTDLRKHIECFSTSMSSDREALFELPVAVDIMLQIAEGMEYLHRKGIVHRDLNPNNILVNPVNIPEMVDAGYFQAKLAGFSLAEQMTCNSCFAEKHVPQTCTLRGCFSELKYVGTFAWMAPELLSDETAWGNLFKTDVYSYAITCYGILTGKMPFDHTISRYEARARTKAGMRPTLPASLPTSLSSLIESCWDTDARMRPPFSEICAKLRQIKYLLMTDDAAATCEKWEQGQLGVHMSRKVGAHEKPVGESPIITLGWRVAYEDNALEFFFQSAESMSSIVGVGLKFGKVVVSASNLEVKIIDIGKETWETELSTFAALKNMLKVVTIDPAEMIGARSDKNSINELLTGKESAEQYGVGLLSGNTVQSTDVPHDSDYCLVLHKIVEYLMLKEVDLAKIGKQCVGNGGAGSSSSGGRSPNQGNDGGSLSGMHADLTSQFGNSQSNSNNDGGDADSSKNQREKLAVDRANTKECRITVEASAQASFFDGKIQVPAPVEVLNEATIKPTLEFHFVINSNGSKRICVETSVGFELGSAAPKPRALNGEFGWYHDPIKFYLEGSKHASLLTPSCVLKRDGSGEAPKATLKLIDTDANNVARELDAGLTLSVPIITTSAAVKEINTTGKTSAQERNFESCAPEVWGFQHQNLFSSVKSKACHFLSHAPLGVSVLRDGPERQQCIGSGLSQSIIPNFVAEWRIQDSDKGQEIYTFGAKRWLNKLVKVQDSTREGSGEIGRRSWRQKYTLPMLVNHAMDHLCNVEGDVVLRENEYVPEVLTVGRAMFDDGGVA